MSSIEKGSLIIQNNDHFRKGRAIYGIASSRAPAPGRRIGLEWAISHLGRQIFTKIAIASLVRRVVYDEGEAVVENFFKGL